MRGDRGCPRLAPKATSGDASGASSLQSGTSRRLGQLRSSEGTLGELDTATSIRCTWKLAHAHHVQLLLAVTVLPLRNVVGKCSVLAMLPPHRRKPAARLSSARRSPNGSGAVGGLLRTTASVSPSEAVRR